MGTSELSAVQADDRSNYFAERTSFRGFEKEVSASNASQNSVIVVGRAGHTYVPPLLNVLPLSYVTPPIGSSSTTRFNDLANFGRITVPCMKEEGG